jgi:hypothetical protein
MYVSHELPKHPDQHSHFNSIRASFNYINGGGGGGGIHTYWSPSQSPFDTNRSKTLEEKWNLKGRFDILVTEICFVNSMSSLLSSNDSMSF